MSRSNPTEGAKSPSTRWFQWAGGDDGGHIKWYDKDAEKNLKHEGPFTFLFLDELATIKGWHDASDSGIYSNEVRDTRQDVMVVRAFKGGELASGLYTAIKDRVAAIGGHYCASIYLAYKDGEELKIGNLSLKGAALSAWMEFKKDAGTKKDAAGKSIRAYFVDAVTITGFEEAKKGATTFRVPKFALKEVSAATNESAVKLDAELQAFLAEYLKRPKSEAAKPAENGNSSHEPPPPSERPRSTFEDFEDNIPF